MTLLSTRSGGFIDLTPGDYRATVLCTLQMTPTIWSIHLQLEGEREFCFLPGQSVWPRFERDGQVFTKIYSIASCPSLSPEIELCISRVGWSSNYMCDLKPGDILDLRGPYGMMTLNDVPQQDIVYVAEGSGIAPIKSHIEWLFQQENPPNVWLFYGGADPSEIAYHALWKDLASHNLKFRYIPLVMARAGDEFEEGRPEKAVREFIKKPTPLLLDICAIEGRVDEIKEALLAYGFNPESIRTERFCSF
jgi:CDP-4-dehydro-6-deoxyglucose reductase, E3